MCCLLDLVVVGVSVGLVADLEVVEAEVEAGRAVDELSDDVRVAGVALGLRGDVYEAEQIRAGPGERPADVVFIEASSFHTRVSRAPHR